MNDGTGWYPPTGAARSAGTAAGRPPTMRVDGTEQSLVDRNARLRAAQKEIDTLARRVRVMLVVLAIGVLFGVLAWWF